MIIKFGLPLTVPTDMRQINTESNSMFNISLLFRRSLLNVTTHFRSKFNSSDCFPDCLQTQQTRHCVVQKVSTLRESESEYDCFLHFLRILAVCWPSAQVHETTTFLLVTLPNIHWFQFFTHMLSNKPFLIWLLITPPDLKYVATLPCNLSLMACFADISVLQGSVATYARCRGIFDIRLTANLPGNLAVKKILKSVKN